MFIHNTKDGRQRRVIGLMAAMILICPFLTGHLYQGDDLLQVSVSIQPRRLSRGEEGKVVMQLSIREDVLISPQPSFTIELDNCEALVFPKNFFSASDLNIDIIEADGEEYLSIKDPLEIPFTVDLEAKAGTHSLSGKIKYFACSKDNHWCLKNTTKFSASFYIRNRTITKE